MKAFFKIIVLLVLLPGCAGEFTPRIEQYVTDSEPKKIGTIVWYKGDIVWARFDEIKTINDSIVNAALSDALRVKKALKSLTR